MKRLAVGSFSFRYTVCMSADPIHYQSPLKRLVALATKT